MNIFICPACRTISTSVICNKCGYSGIAIPDMEPIWMWKSDAEIHEVIPILENRLIVTTFDNKINESVINLLSTSTGQLEGEFSLKSLLVESIFPYTTQFFIASLRITIITFLKSEV